MYSWAFRRMSEWRICWGDDVWYAKILAITLLAFLHYWIHCKECVSRYCSLPEFILSTGSKQGITLAVVIAASAFFILTSKKCRTNIKCYYIWYKLNVRLPKSLMNILMATFVVKVTKCCLLIVLMGGARCLENKVTGNCIWGHFLRCHNTC